MTQLQSRVRSDELRPLRRFRLGDVRVEPDLVAVRIKDLERPITPPLQGERITDGDAFLLQTVVKRVDIFHFEVDLDGLFPASVTRCRRALA